MNEYEGFLLGWMEGWREPRRAYRLRPTVD